MQHKQSHASLHAAVLNEVTVYQHNKA